MSPPNLDAQPFRHYSLKHRAVAWISENLCRNVTYRQRHGLVKGMLRQGGLGWLPAFLHGSTITPEQVFWMNRDLHGLVIYDVGAFQGLLTMFFAQRARQVISYEPNTGNHARLVENLRLNNLDNVMVRKIGLGSKRESAMMVTSPVMPGGASIERHTVAGLRNSGSALVSEEICLTTLDDDIQAMSLPPPDFIKIDIEGAELAALQGARSTLLTHKPQLFIELHGETMELKRENVADVVACLQHFGYRDIQHVETGAIISAGNSTTVPEGHLYCLY